MWFLYRELRRGAEIPNPKAWTLLVVKREIWRSLWNGKRRFPLEPNMLVADAAIRVNENGGESRLADFLSLFRLLLLGECGRGWHRSRDHLTQRGKPSDTQRLALGPAPAKRFAVQWPALPTNA